MKREKLLRKIGKALAATDASGRVPTKVQFESCEREYLELADVALKALAKVINKTPEVPWGDHSIDADLVDFLAGELDEYAPLDER